MSEPVPSDQPEGSIPTLEPTAVETAADEKHGLFNLPGKLERLNPENLDEISEISQIKPDSPPFFHIAPDGSRAAVSIGQGINIFDTYTGETLMTLPAILPDCSFGFKRAFRLNADGSFLALLNGFSIQVWQVGGGLIYESQPYHDERSQPVSCGGDIPELALSPDGKLLAVSGVAYLRSSIRRYFRVIDIIANEVLYEWDGSHDSLHGSFYSTYGLGFSDDGAMLQTFDPALFIPSEGRTHETFRFWSVEGWQEIPAISWMIKESFQPGRLLYTRSNDGVLYVVSKINGEIIRQVAVTGCLWDAPCETRFSDSGGQMLLLDRSGEQVLIRQDSLFNTVSLWDLSLGEKTGEETGQVRDLEGLLPRDDGSVLRGDQLTVRDPSSPSWWTYKENFTGLQLTKDGLAAFTPLMADGTGSSQACQFCRTCLVDAAQGDITCADGIPDSEGMRVMIKKEADQFMLVRQNGAETTAVGPLALPDYEDFSQLRVRLLGFDMPQQTLFYCVDEDKRQRGCFIYDPYLKLEISDPKDIAFLRFSPDGKNAAFINRKARALFIYDLAEQSLVRKEPYQARAYLVNPVFSSDGETLLYVVQNLDNPQSLSVEVLDARTFKATGRVSLKKAGIIAPAIFIAFDRGAFWAFADEAGVISAVETEKGVLEHSWQAHSDAIIGLAADPENRWLLSMGEDGTLNFWGIPK